MQPQIPMGLQALLKASAVLQQTATSTAPGPQGEQPTVASQIAQQAQQAIPAMPEIKQQAGIGNQLRMQQMAQKQQAAQNPEAIAQMAANMMRQGAGSLPVNMQFKEGGIIGFQEGGEPRFTSDWEERRKRLLEERGTTPVSKFFEEMFGGPTGRASQGNRRAVPKESGADEVQYVQPLTEREIPSDTGAQLGAKPVQVSREAPEPEVQKKPEEDFTKGIMALQSQAAPRPAEPKLSDIQSQARGMSPDFKSRETALKELASQREAAMAQMPSLSQEGIAALQEARQRRKDLLEQERKYDTFRRIGALGQSFYTKGPEYQLINQAIAKREEADISADLAHQQAVLKLKEAEQNRQLGRFDRAEELLKQGIALDTTAAKVDADNFKALAGLAGDVFGAQARMFSDAMNRRSAEAIAIAELAAKAKLAGDERLSRNINLLQARLNDANEKVKNELKLDSQLLSIRMMGVNKANEKEKAEILKLQQEFLQKQEETERRYNVPSLKQQLLRLGDQSLGTSRPAAPSPTMKFDRSGNPIR